jgi:hypothetical protein
VTTLIDDALRANRRRGALGVVKPFREGFVDREGGSSSLEARWILPGRVPNAMIEWLGPFADAVEDREDRYLVNPSCDELGVKIRGAVQLDLKAFRGSPGTLRIPGGGQGRLEIWERWSFPLNAEAHPPADASSWLAVQKVRRRRSFRMAAEGRAVERAMSESELPGCTVELTEVAVGEEKWWSLGFEVHGRSETLEATLHATIGSLTPGPTPDTIRLDLMSSMSYPRWLGTSTLDRVAVATTDVLETSSLDLMLVRLAALAAVDAPTAS